MQIPSDRLYTKGHLWIKPLESGVKMGITDFAQDQLDDIVFIDLPATGIFIKAGGFLAGIQHHDGVFELHTPVGGEVLSVNEHLHEEPETVNEDPYENGWLVILKPQGKKLPQLLSAKEYGEHMTSIISENDDL